ncbi:ERV1/ALR-related protein [Pirellula sp. SH-Sr6A]|uniref:ERV1/ALR-related protein n=1 Tax=Pirellula sp. SH-Sr6A TaxID=1632865 RepID=UPI0011BADC79
MDDPVFSVVNPVLRLLRGEITPSEFASLYPSQLDSAPTQPSIAVPAPLLQDHVFDVGWVPLHRVAFRLQTWADIEAWYRMWESISIPCGACRRHWAGFKELDPPRFHSRIEFFWWSHRAHNSVSKRIGRSVWSCGRFWRRYRCK